MSRPAGCPISITLLALGVARLEAPAFGRRLGGATVALGVTGIGAASAILLDPVSPIAAVGFLALIVFHLILGWKVYRLSNSPGIASAGLATFRVTQSALSS